MSRVRDLARLMVALPVVMVGIGLLKVNATMEEIYPLRKILVRRGWFRYRPPDAEAIRECSNCDYIGVLNVDKHRYAPMSDMNWGLHCPDCNTEIDGPLHVDAVAEYVNLCRGSDVIGDTMKIGAYGAFKTVQSHNARYALPMEKIQELEALDEVEA